MLRKEIVITARLSTFVLLCCAPLLVANADPESASNSHKTDTDSQNEIRSDPEHYIERWDYLPTPHLRPGAGNCTNTYEKVMSERDAPMFRRDSALLTTNNAIRAVDYRIDGCAFMVIGQDVRPVPEPPSQDVPLHIQPAEAQPD